MTNPLNEPYYEWLRDQIWFNYRHFSLKPHEGLSQALWAKPFAWTVPNDDNRLEDGLELRYLFLTDEELGDKFETVPLVIIAEFRSQPCSMLEVLIALSRRLAFAAGGDAQWWAWKLLTNLGLNKMRDPITRKKAERIDEILDQLIWRTYNWDGAGGFFPLAFPHSDQTKVEIWYQMAEYLQEFNHP